METFLLAAARQDIMTWGAIFSVATFIGGIAVKIIRKKALSKDSTTVEGFTLDDLRKIRDRGELSEQEYQVAKNQITQAARKSLHEPRKSEKSRKDFPSSPFGPSL